MIKQKIILPIFFLIILSLSIFVSAETYTINIRGEPRTPNGQIDLMYGAELVTDQGKIQTDSTIDNDGGFFEIRNAVLNTDASFNYVSPHIQGTCFYHAFRIMRNNNQFEVSDASRSDKEILIKTTDTNINLGVLKEDKSNQVMVDFDVPVKFLAEDLSGNWVAENGGYAKFTGISNSFKSNTRYKLTLTTEDGETIVREITTGNYCESTRVIKRGSYFVIETNTNNSFPSIGFFRNIWMSILGFRMIVVLPLIAIFLAIILIFFLIFRRKKSSNNLM